MNSVAVSQFFYLTQNTMARSKASKQTIIETLADNIAKARSLAFVSLKGLMVKEAEELRRNLRKEEVDCMMAKKTLIRRSLERQGITEVDPKKYEGEIAVCCSYTDEVAPARITSAFAKTHEAMHILGGIIMQQVDGKPLIIDAAGMKRLASLPSQQELRGKLVASLSSPMRGMVSVLAGNLRSFVQVLNAIKETKS